MDHSVRKLTPYRVISIALLIILALMMLFPLYWIVTGSVKDARTINSRTPVLFPTNPTLDNYTKLFSRPAWTWMFNTVFICGVAMLLTCLCGAMGGYALAKKKFTGRNFIFGLFVCAMALPKQVIMIPLLKEMAWLGLHNTLWSVIFPTVGWPFGVFLMKQFAEGIPNEMLEAAKIDGANGWQTLTKVIIPNVMPSITTCTFLTLTNSFKLFDQNLALTGGLPSVIQNGAKVNITELLALNIYSTYNINKKYHGVAQTKAVIFFLLVAVLALIQQAATRKKEVEQ